MRPRLVETDHCMFPSGEQCRATFHVTPKEVVYAIRWMNLENAYGSLQKEADQWIEGCVRKFLAEHPECESLAFRQDRK
jgi:hypothetical protein